MAATCLLLTIALGLAPGCATRRPPLPDVSYRAEVLVEVAPAEGTPHRVRVVEFQADGRRRRQTRVDGRQVVLIDRPDLQVSWLLDPEARSFEEHRIASRDVSLGGLPDPFRRRAGMRFELLGTERVDGVPVRRYAVRGRGIEGEAWIARDGVPLRFSGRVRLDAVGPRESADPFAGLELVYTGIERRPLASHLFEIPPSYAGWAQRKQRRAGGSWELDEQGRRLRERQRTLPSRPIPFAPY